MPAVKSGIYFTFVKTENAGTYTGGIAYLQIGKACNETLELRLDFGFSYSFVFQ